MHCILDREIEYEALDIKITDPNCWVGGEGVGTLYCACILDVKDFFLPERSKIPMEEHLYCG